MSKANSKFAKIWTGFVWLLFLPNTIYILTDLIHLFDDLKKVGMMAQFILIVQYLLFSTVGIIMFVVSIYYFQELLEQKSHKNKKMKLSTFLWIFAVNMLVGFGVVLGAILRTNSWYLFTDLSRVIRDVSHVLRNHDLILFSIGVGLSANVIYFYLVDGLAEWGNHVKKEFSKRI